MADNVSITPGSGASIASDEIVIGGNTVQVQRVKITLGTDGNYQSDLATGQATAANSLPVVLASDKDATLADDAAFTAATSRVMPIGATYQATADEVGDGDIGAPRMTIRRAVMNAADYRYLQLTQAAPAPSGTDILTGAGGAIASGDLRIRDTSFHTFTIPVWASGWRKIAIVITASPAHDQACNFFVWGKGGAAANIALNSGTIAAASLSFAVANNGLAASSTIATGQILQTPALEIPWQTVILGFQFGSAPSTGDFTIDIMRSS